MLKKMLISAFILFLIIGCSVPVEEPIEEPVEEVEVPIIRDIFTGEILEADAIQKPAVAIMIGNTSEARPQSGLSVADVVYEISVETMMITRYMAIFSSEIPTKVGPIRSVRMPFVTMLNEWDVAIAHFGGSNVGEANAMTVLESMWVPIRYDGVMNINSEYFFRDSKRPAPHNAYMDLKEASEDFPDMWPRAHFDYSEEVNNAGDPVTSVNINYTNFIRNGYEYDETVNKYLKRLNDRLHMDDYTNAPIYVTNLVIQHADHKIVERAQYVLVNFFYSGDADFFINGQHIKGRWVKDSRNDITHWMDMNKNPIEFLPGNTWIHVVHDKVKITYE